METRSNPFAWLAVLAISLLLAAGTAWTQNQSSNAHASYSNFFGALDGPTAGMPLTGASSTLVRTNRGVSVSVHAAGLEPGDVYTLWWIIFNRPQACMGNPEFPEFNCVERDDAFDPVTEPSLGWAAGRVVDEYGFASFNAHLLLGEGMERVVPAGGLPIFDDWQRGLTSRVAEIHVALRSHGQAEALLTQDPSGELLEEALTSLFGGCNTNECVTTHFAVHER